MGPGIPSADAASYPSSTYVLKGKVIVLDPGHDGSDTGAIGPTELAEKEVTLAIAQELRKLLASSGAMVVMTRTKDTDVAYMGAADKMELQARVNVANHLDADLFISIHADAFGPGNARGSTTYFYNKLGGEDKLLASSLQSSLVQRNGLYNRGILENDFYVLKHTAMPAALVEVGFISNPQEEALLRSAVFKRKIAQGLFEGIENYFF